jgi:hypothetical protein
MFIQDFHEFATVSLKVVLTKSIDLLAIPILHVLLNKLVGFFL